MTGRGTLKTPAAPSASLSLLFAAVAFIAVACGSGTQEQQTSGVPAAQSAPKFDVPDFEITPYGPEDVSSGATVRFHDLLAQGKPVVLNMWAGLCPPCRAEMPDFQEVHEKFKEQVTIFGLDVGPYVGLGSRADGQRLLQELKITYPTGSTFDGEVIRKYGLVGMPTTYFITAKGKIMRKYTGLLSKGLLTQYVNDLIRVSST